MSHQEYFNYNLKEIRDSSNFFVNSTNEQSYKIVINNNKIKNIFLKAPNKSGKSHLINMWVKNNNSILIEKLRNNGLLIVGANENVIRILPPLNVTKKELKIALKIIEKTCEDINKR